MFVTERFELTDYQQDHLHSLVPEFGYNGFGEIVFYRTYSRIKRDGGQETWADVVIRFINGVFSIRKDWYYKNHLYWDQEFWQKYAFEMALSAFIMEWTPPGRGQWAMGSDFVYEEGSMATQNCGYVDIEKDLATDLCWGMDALMLGVGVGYGPLRDNNLKLYNPSGNYDFIIPDSREGWIESVHRLITAYQYSGQKKPRMIYDLVRPAGLPIKRFGGISSGPEPLIWFHKFIEQCCERYQESREYDSVRLKADLANGTGCCIVAGNVRRSAEKLRGSIQDKTYLELKNYKLHPERANVGWMCLDKQTWISTTEGPRQIIDLINKPFIAMVDGWKHKSDGFFNAGTKSVIEIDAQGYSLRCSPDHKIMTEFGWRKAGDLLVGERIRLNDCGIGEWNGEGTIDEGYILGVIMGDGCIQKDNRCSISSSMLDIGAESIRERILNLASSMPRFQFNLSPKWHMPPSHEETKELRLSCSYFLNIAKKFGVEFGNKTITKEIESASSDFYKGFLRGFFDTDGNVEKLGANRLSRGVRLSQSDKKCIQAVQRMLSRLGIQSRICAIKGSDWSKKDPYILTIRSESALLFREKVGFTHLEKAKLLNEHFIIISSRKRLMASITSIRKDVEIEMYDCTIENVHAYDANGIYVSNSNNSVQLWDDEDFDCLGEIARRVIVNGEPGYDNLRNFPFARIGKSMKGLRKDKAKATNPCGISVFCRAA